MDELPIRFEFLVFCDAHAYRQTTGPVSVSTLNMRSSGLFIASQINEIVSSETMRQKTAFRLEDDAPRQSKRLRCRL
jgi:hypothetical protein